MKIDEKINECRKIMKEKKVAAYIVPTSDFHQSEYIADYFKGREFLTGFTGSAGTFIIFEDESCLWVDGRYHIQAENQIKGSEIKLFKQGNDGVPTFIDYLILKLDKNSKIAFDSRQLSCSVALEILAKSTLKVENFDILESIWKKRKNLPSNKIFLLEEKYSGKNTLEKISEIRKIMKEKNVKHNIISSLDDIAWIFNFRGNDINNNPIALSFAIISEKNVTLYINSSKLDKKSVKYFAENKIEVKNYFDIFEDIKKLNGSILVDYNKISYEILNSIDKKNEVVNSINPSTYLKAHKNEIEIENTKEIHIADGVAVTKFMYWLKNNFEKEIITEIIAEEKINSLRKEILGFMGLSFDTISAFGKNAAMMHYKANVNNKTRIKNGAYLLDSGGQYLKGTTDITRTFFLGKVPKIVKVHNTLVLKGMLALTKAKFLYGATGTNLDILARQFLWNENIDYKCGTGHGVGHFLNVHEGPHGIRFQYNSQRLEEGMIVTNEPGAYIEGSHGIRIENELLVKKAFENEHGKFLEFETLTFAPIDLDGIVRSMLTKEEKQQLNLYHTEVYKKLSKFLNKKERDFLKEYTMAI